ncbi:MAG: CBS domain-containing protein, partial [Nitrospinales bacterium]
MTKKVTTISPQETVEKVFFIFNTKNIRHLPVMQKGKLVGIISDRDIKKIIPKKPRKIMRPDGKSYTMVKDALHK